MYRVVNNAFPWKKTSDSAFPTIEEKVLDNVDVCNGTEGEEQDH